MGKLKAVLPLEPLSRLLPNKKYARGAEAWFDNQGILALMFLKSYTRTSDASLIEQLNGNWHMQFFCGIQLKDDSYDSRLGNRDMIAGLGSSQNKTNS